MTNLTWKNDKRILSLSHISKSFSGVQALKDASLNLNKGEIHVLIGENGAGKSTLMKVLLGLYTADSGEIDFKGRTSFFKSPHEALLNGISMIHQELCLVPSMTIYENIWMGREKQFSKLGLIRNKQRRDEAERLLKRLGIDLDPGMMVRELSVAQMQLVEIARAISYNSDIIIMDEPTSALSKAEIELLYRIVKQLATSGTGIIFMSHKLDEVFALADRISVLRDGTSIGTYLKEDITEEELVKLIIGRTFTSMYAKEAADIKEKILEVKNLSVEGVVDNINFYVRKGEILGFYGLVGAKRTETMRAVFGADKKSGGTITLEGKDITINSPTDAICHGIGMVTEDRLRSGAIFTMDIKGNATLVAYRHMKNKIGLSSPPKELSAFYEIAKKLQIKYGSAKNKIGTLSGGNQQKVMIARWLLINPKVLILDEPTRGIDVGAKSEIYKLINTLAKEGMAIIMVSSEMQEIISMCDRIMVMSEGKIVTELSGDGMTQEMLGNSVFERTEVR